MNISITLEATARREPSRTALIFEGRAHSYAEIETLANKVANGLCANGITTGDMVALICSSRPEFVISYFGILKTGATVVALSDIRAPHGSVDTLSESEIARRLRGTGVKALICLDGHADTLLGEAAIEAVAAVEGCRSIWLIPGQSERRCRALGAPTLDDLLRDQPATYNAEQVAPDATATILSTSGTTGVPKQTEITHANLLATAVINRGVGEFGTRHVRLVAHSLHHIVGQALSLHLGFLGGDTLVLAEHLEPNELLSLMVTEGVTHIMGPPQMYAALVEASGLTSAIRLQIVENLQIAATGGQPLEPSLNSAFTTKFGQSLRSGYGLTETTATASWHCPEDEIRVGSVGRPLPGISIRVADGDSNALPVGETGEILVRSPSVMKGYLGKPEATADAFIGGWFRTGDAGRLDEDGYLYVEGRLDDMIFCGGYKFYPAEIEGVLVGYPGVHDVAVVHMPNKAGGDVLKAFVVPHPGTRVDSAALHRWMRSQLQESKLPGIVEFCSSLPETGTGKVARHLLSR
jgi:long-chain acyl-CoA synthetase